MAEKDIAATPMMRQFYELKAKHPDAVLLFRCGDFYETYCSDAVVASEILGITLTKRSNGKSDAAKAIEMAGFPFHALDNYLPKLVRAGKRVAICDQLEDPKMTKKLVKRGITELVTPGVSINDNMLDYKENNFLAAVHFGKPMCGVSFLDISTGEYLVAEGTFDYIEKLLINFRPKEILIERGLKGRFIECFGSKFLTFELDDWAFTDEFANEKLTKHFETKNLKGFGISHLRSGVVAAGAILHYLEVTLHTQISHIRNISRIEEERYVRLDKFTIRSLELLGSMHDGGSSLLSVIDNTLTAMGARLLKRWMVFPLKDKKPIEERLDIVEYYFREPYFRELIEDQLHLIGDLDPLLSRCQVYVLESLNKAELLQLTQMALQRDLLLRERNIVINEHEALFHFSGGDARKLLNILDLLTTAHTAEGQLVITNDLVYRALQQNPLAYDKNGEQHYDIISAFIKSIRGSHPDAAIYWLARMLEAGEDPKFIARRLLISASEDIGLANPNALLLASATFDAVHKLGMPEARIPLAEATIYLATSAKSNSAYSAINAALERVRQTGNLPVPLHLRNAPTQLMSELGYAGGYLYPHDYPGNFAPQQYLPDALSADTLWHPCQNPSEQKMADHMERLWQKKR